MVETTTFEAKAAKLFTDEERRIFTNALANDPELGDLLKGTGGVRKVRVAIEGRGKSGGARVVYFFHNDSMPLFLLTVFAKNEKDNLSKAERNALKKFCIATVKDFEKKG